MAVETGVATSELEQICGFPIEILDFEDLGVDAVYLTDADRIKTLLPDFKYHPDRYQFGEVICISESGRAVMGIFRGTYLGDGEKIPTVSLVNLAADPEKVILASSETEPLNIGTRFWPGYNIEKHQKNLGLGLETMSIKKDGDQFIISFPEVQEV